MASPQDPSDPANGEPTRSSTSNAPQPIHTEQQHAAAPASHPQNGGPHDPSRSLAHQPATSTFQTHNPRPQQSNPSVTPFPLPSDPNDPNNLSNDRHYQAYMNSGFSPFSASTQEILKRVGASPNVSAGSPEWEAARRRVIESMNSTSAATQQVRQFQWGQQEYAYVLSKDVKRNWRAGWAANQNAAPSAPAAQNGTTPESSAQAPSNTNASAAPASAAPTQDTPSAASPSRGSGRGPGRPRGRSRGRPQTRNRGGTSTGRKRKRDSSDAESSSEAVGVFLTFNADLTPKYPAHTHKPQSHTPHGSQSSDASDPAGSGGPYYTVTKFGRNVHRPQQFQPPSGTTANRSIAPRAAAASLAREPTASSIPPPIPPTTPIRGLAAPRGRRPKHSGTPEFTLCRKCGRDHSPEGNVIVFCDGCNVSWHQWCHDPAIPREVVEVERMSWFCGGCANQREMARCGVGERVGAGELGLSAEEVSSRTFLWPCFSFTYFYLGVPHRRPGGARGYRGQHLRPDGLTRLKSTPAKRPTTADIALPIDAPARNPHNPPVAHRNPAPAPPHLPPNHEITPPPPPAHTRIRTGRHRTPALPALRRLRERAARPALHVPETGEGSAGAEWGCGVPGGCEVDGREELGGWWDVWALCG